MIETIVMIHGMQVGGWCWSRYKEFFSQKGYLCVTPTLRFHDTRPPEPASPRLGTVSLLDYVEDLEREIKKLDRPPIVMGHSMGGLLAQIIGSHGLAKVLVLLSPAWPRGVIGLRPSVMRTFWSAQTKYGFWKKPFRLTFKEVAHSMLQLMPVDDQAELYKRFGYESGRVACEIGYWFFDGRRASAVDEAKITCPVLIIAGGRDEATPAKVVRKVANRYGSSSTYKEFPNHSHWVIGEPGWQEIASYVCDWLNQVLDESS